MGAFYIRFVMFTSTLVRWLIILPPGAGWGIIGYEYVPLPSDPKLRNCFYSVKLITPLPRLFLWLIYCVLIPPAHHPSCPWHPLRLREKFIDRPAGHLLRYVCLPTLYVYFDGVEPGRFHRLLYRWIIPLSAGPTFLRHTHDSLRRPMVEFRQGLEHLPGRHPTLDSIY